MLGRLILLMTVVPFIEIYLLLKIGQSIGAGPTFLLIISTGFFGAFLLQRQGHSILREMQMNAANNQIPADAMVKGLFTFLGGVLLLTPGILTDVLGLSLILPGTQQLWRMYFTKQWQEGIRRGNIHVYTNIDPRMHQQRPPKSYGRHIDGENEVIDISANKSKTDRD